MIQLVQILQPDKNESYWQSNPQLGAGYFELNNLSDSTDNAIAGPIPIGFKFVFNEWSMIVSMFLPMAQLL
jgi:hypothetical protein